MMMKPQITQLSHSTKTPFLLHKPFIHGNGNGNASVVLPIISRHSFQKKKKNVGVGFIPTSNSIKAVASTTENEKATSVEAIVTVKLTVGGFLSNLGIDRGLDDIKDLLGKTVHLEFVSAELDSRTGLEKETIKAYAQWTSKEENEVKYESSFEIPEDFGEVGAILVENGHQKEMFFKDIILNGFPYGPLHINCNSWVHSKNDNPRKRVFFANKSYLPSKTPSGLGRLREEELEVLRGNGQGERKSFERVYDYDVYNDLGDPNTNEELKRPVLGGKQHPYPRRCRTGRQRCDTDPLSEKRSSGSTYVPRDESFSEEKRLTFSAKTIYSVLHALVPSLETAIFDSELGFPNFTAIDSLFNEGVNLPPFENQKKGFLSTLLPRLVKAIANTGEDVLRFETTDTMDRDKFFWFRDEEFARQTLAGVNPYSIQLVTEWPLKGKLDPKIYGPPESAITTELIERTGDQRLDDHQGGNNIICNAINQKKLFILDYHDLFLPYVSKVREIKGTTLYGSRTLFFLTPEGTLRPLAIELTRPPMDGKPQWKQVFMPCWNATGVWQWRLAKAHVLAHDSGVHQLVQHWLRTHAAIEPYVIATNRQLSVVHPIYRLLHPHFRYTMDINALAQQILINGGGIIESSFSPGKYSMELSSVAYDQQWQFNLQALPADLINRGMAVEDPTAPHGLKLIIEDYPFANDGLVLWNTIKDRPRRQKDEKWWPVLKTPEDFIEIITTIAWVASGHHAAVNFGQYSYTGYFPNRPTIARTNMPTEDPSEESWNNFLRKPESVLLECFPTQIQATRMMAVMDILSNHSPDEEYLGDLVESAWDENLYIKGAFERFKGKLMRLEGIIDKRNANKNLMNRSGAGIVAYELLKPFSPPGVTGKGVPYSISI
ncbi:hypothetical protein FH972_009687 [Carpinus fangiana]|uniref:Lipoxygenase n=1 Tax=Carpinus fangiana TaxID=176857 RepID=A0A660KL27_9ROSI|nr:hypothetical protein FH972_009687 [Carpinus fangiana]